MKFGRIAIGLAGLLGGLLSVTSQAQMPSEGAPVTNGTTQRQLNTQALVQWLTAKNIMDVVSANELALSLSERELSAMIAAINNPMIQKSDTEAVPIREK